MTIRGVVFSVLVTLLSVLMLVLAYDYSNVRKAAARGAAAYEFLDNAIKAQQAQQKPPAPPPQEEKK